MFEAMNFVHRTIADLKKMTFLERLTAIIAAIEPLSAIPQLWLVWSTRSAEDLAFFTEAFGIFSAIIWLAYGISIKNIPIIISAAFWLVIAIPILIAIILFG